MAAIMTCSLYVEGFHVRSGTWASNTACSCNEIDMPIRWARVAETKPPGRHLFSNLFHPKRPELPPKAAKETDER